MILTTTPEIPNVKIKNILGIVKGNTVRARHIGRDIMAGLKSIIGGEIKSYTDLMTSAREEAIHRMKKEAEKIHADAIVNVRFATSSIMQGASEIVAYGTAVKLN